MRYQDKVFQNDRIELDGNEYVDCKFINCKLVFTGYEEVSFDRCGIIDSEWVFDGPATNTLLFLSAMSRGLGEKGQKLVRDIFRSIEDGTIAERAVESPAEPAVATVR